LLTVKICVDAFLTNMKAVPSPFLKKTRLTKSAQKGKKIFYKANCINCHCKPYFTDGKLYDVGTTGKFDITLNKDGKPIPQKTFVTPSLIELYRTAPYLHDGRYYTLEELFEEGTHGQIKKSTEKLENEEIRQLIDYLNSL
jgi:cytochrome c peroxidase